MGMGARKISLRGPKFQKWLHFDYFQSWGQKNCLITILQGDVKKCPTLYEKNLSALCIKKLLICKVSKFDSMEYS